MRSAAVAIVGGGVIGASVAYYLARGGMRDIVILDRAPAPGWGSTGKATGGFRAQFVTSVNVRLSLLARESLLRFRDETGVDPGFMQAGYLWLAGSESDLESLREAHRVQTAEGLHEAHEVDLREIALINPAVALDGVCGGAFCPTDGFIKPLEMLRGYLTAASRLGVGIEWDTDVVGVTKSEQGRAATVVTSRGEIAVDSIVNAAGPWAASLAALAGVSLPVTPLRRQVALTEPCDRLPANMPMTIFLEDGFHLRVRDGRVLLAWPSPAVSDEPFETSIDDSWISHVSALAFRRIPALRGVRIDRSACYAGLYEMSPDNHAILGASKECENFFLANGSSGHGVMHSPALGQLLADIICGRETAIDVTPLSPLRFVEGRKSLRSELL
ncbi:MAG: FAD-binding oxidoreductase [Gemmatimonadaceae bacterium]|nr:FAD-binding oxidoreductase [Gemmatimonadaceae bacterium]